MRPDHLDTLARSLAARRDGRAALVATISNSLGLLGIPAPHKATTHNVEGHHYALTLSRGVDKAFTFETYLNSSRLGGNLFFDVSAGGDFGALPSSDMVYATFIGV